MQPTRATWQVGALVILLSALAVVLAAPYLLAGGVIIAAWLLGRQAAFLAATDELSSDITVEQSLADTTIAPNNSTTATLAASHPPTHRLHTAVTAGIPLAARTDAVPAVSLTDTFTDATAQAAVSWPAAGRYTLDHATLDTTDGLFRQSLSVGNRPTITVSPAPTSAFHVGAGGDPIAGAFGSHPTDSPGAGFDPLQVREYTPDDPANQIDWKTTARHEGTYVREFSAETDRERILLVDHRRHTSVGRPGRTIIDGLRSVASSLVASARHTSDPVGLVTIGDTETRTLDPATASHELGRIRRTLDDLEADDTIQAPTRTRTTAQPPDTGLTGTDAFASTLRPFLADRRAYRHRVEATPLYSVLETAIHGRPSQSSIAILTDDTDRPTIRETVRLARRHDHHVRLYLAPRVLYEDDTAVDPEQAYERYLDFEQFRRDLASWPGVDAYEVGPRDRLAEVLAGKPNPATEVTA